MILLEAISPDQFDEQIHAHPVAIDIIRAGQFVLLHTGDDRVDAEPGFMNMMLDADYFGMAMADAVPGVAVPVAAKAIYSSEDDGRIELIWVQKK